MRSRLIQVFLVIISALFLALIVRAWKIRPRIDLVPIAEKEHFERPVSLKIVRIDNRRGFLVIEKAGRIRLIWDNSADPAVVMGDLRSEVYSEGWEDGLLDAELDPGFDQNGIIYTFFDLAKEPTRTVLRKYLIRDLKIITFSGIDVLTTKKAAIGHNGGQLRFSEDGMLFVSIGDGHTPAEILQSGKTWLGSILRIDVRNSRPGKPYSVPSDNPFVKSGLRPPEVYAFGLRNPWRMMFDKKNNNLYAGDVGDKTWEEMNKILKGADYGWPIVEGPDCYPPEKEQNCDKSGKKAPMIALNHSLSRSVIGGTFYRGESLRGLKGKMIYADYLKGIFAQKIDDKNTIETKPDTILMYKMPTPYGPMQGLPINIVAFEQDEENELYAVSFQGTIHKLAPLSFWGQVKGFLYQMGNL